jgi:anti-anti-sigma factor
MNPLCSVDLAQQANATVATLRGEIDLSNAAEIEAQLAVAGERADALVVDLGALDYIDSSGFGMLERLSRKTTLRVAVPETSVVRRAFEITGLGQVVRVFPGVDEALATD